MSFQANRLILFCAGNFSVVRGSNPHLYRFMNFRVTNPLQDHNCRIGDCALIKISSNTMSMMEPCPFACISAAQIERISKRFYIGDVYENLPINSKFR